MNIQKALEKIISKNDLEPEEMTEVMQKIMSGEATSAQIAGLLVALRMKGETVDEITAAAKVMSDYVTPVDVEGEHLVDIVGTGGDNANTFNISTTCTFVVAATGAKVAKHGNRSVSSASGSADLLQAAGVNINLSPEQVAQCIHQINIGFMFAPQHHSAMKYAIAPRKELGIRTLFNLLGPLTNPAHAKNQLIGVYSPEWVEPIAKVCLALGSKQAMVVHSKDGLDEISIADETFVAEIKSGDIYTYKVRPENYGLPAGNLDDLRADTPKHSLEITMRVLDGEPGAPLNIVLLNAGTAIYLAGKAKDISEGIDKARAAINTGMARKKLDELIELSHKLKETKNDADTEETEKKANDEKTS